MIGTAPAEEIVVFHEAYLGLDTGFVSIQNSFLVEASWETVAIQATLHNSSNLAALNELELFLEGSYDGRVWQTSGLTGGTKTILFSSDQPEAKQTSDQILSAYPFLRLVARLNGAEGETDKALFSAALVFTHQKN